MDRLMFVQVTLPTPSTTLGAIPPRQLKEV